MKVGILYICTGAYTVFWPDFFQSFQQNFLPGVEKTYYVFTDAERIDHDDDPRRAPHLPESLRLALQHPQAV